MVGDSAAAPVRRHEPPALVPADGLQVRHRDHVAGQIVWIARGEHRRIGRAGQAGAGQTIRARVIAVIAGPLLRIVIGRMAELHDIAGRVVFILLGVIDEIVRARRPRAEPRVPVGGLRGRVELAPGGAGEPIERIVRVAHARVDLLVLIEHRRLRGIGQLGDVSDGVVGIDNRLQGLAAARARRGRARQAERQGVVGIRLVHAVAEIEPDAPVLGVVFDIGEHVDRRRRRIAIAA